MFHPKEGRREVTGEKRLDHLPEISRGLFYEEKSRGLSSEYRHPVALLIVQNGTLRRRVHSSSQNLLLPKDSLLDAPYPSRGPRFVLTALLDVRLRYRKLSP